jgi:hypothetical protein
MNKFELSQDKRARSIREQEMIQNFLKTKEVTNCDIIDDQLSLSDTFHLKTKSHRSAFDYNPDPLWDGLVVFDTKLIKDFYFKVKKLKQTAWGNGGIKAHTFTYSKNDKHNGIRENTITKRISSGRYEIIKNPIQN